VTVSLCQRHGLTPDDRLDGVAALTDIAGADSLLGGLQQAYVCTVSLNLITEYS